MQVQKEDIRKSILAAARAEFAKNGFEKASVRTITARAKTSKSNFYNYFSDKDALFAAVVEPALSGLEQTISELRNVNLNPDNSMPAHREAMSRLMDCIYHNEAFFRLLFFKSSGSALASYRDTATDLLAGVLYLWTASIRQAKPPTELFTRTIASFYLKVMEQMLSQGMSHEQAAVHIYEFLKFLYGGWNEVLS